MLKGRIKEILLYLCVGALSVVAAIYISSYLVTPSRSQEQVEGLSALPPPPLPPPLPPELDKPLLPPPKPPTEATQDVTAKKGDVIKKGVPVSGEASLVVEDPANSSRQQPVPVPIEEPVVLPKGNGLNMDTAIEIESFLAPFSYDNENRRDPFREYKEIVASQGEEDIGMIGPLSPLQRYELDEIQLVGIIWDVKWPKAMFLDPNEQIHIVGKDERVGRKNGYIATIREGEVVIIETLKIRGELAFSTRILKLAR